MKFAVLLICTLTTTAYARLDSDGILAKLWSKHDDGSLDPILFNMEASSINVGDLGQISKIKLDYLSGKNKIPKIIKKLSLAEAYEVISMSSTNNSPRFILSKEAKKTLELTYANIEATKTVLSVKDLKEVLFETPDRAYYNNGEYKDTVSLFLLCRSNRKYPCLFVIKDIFGQLVREDDGSLWSLPALAKSAANKPSNVTNGETPMGVHILDSVMPEADQNLSFGEFRRVILNWLPANTEPAEKYFLPRSQILKSWWKQASIARDAKRVYLRIHGTGRINSNPNSSYYPHTPTAGCISTREGNYPQLSYQDQRIVLDKLMEASQLAPVFQNEINISGVLFVMNINHDNKRVSLKDLALIGIE